MPIAAAAKLIARFGPINNDNDRSNVRLLAAVDAQAIDFLLTQDTGPSPTCRARQWLKQTFTERLKLPSISKTQRSLAFFEPHIEAGRKLAKGWRPESFQIVRRNRSHAQESKSSYLPTRTRAFAQAMQKAKMVRLAILTTLARLCL